MGNISRMDSLGELADRALQAHADFTGAKKEKSILAARAVVSLRELVEACKDVLGPRGSLTFFPELAFDFDRGRWLVNAVPATDYSVSCSFEVGEIAQFIRDKLARQINAGESHGAVGKSERTRQILQEVTMLEAVVIMLKRGRR